ncbi:MAG: DUF4965 domain-containing protein [Clostridia bacterium]|nr:DUF4965 domain-containing protein [Clostridia bacterium]
MKKNTRLMSAYPLFVKDPSFSVWSNGDILNESDTTLWNLDSKRTYGLVIADGESYCFLGDAPNVKKLTQTGVEVTAFRTVYRFTAERFDLEVAFFSPLPLSDYEVLSCPVCFMEYTLTPKTKLGKASVCLSLGEGWCYNGDEIRDMRGDVFKTGDVEIGYFGLNKQTVFNRTCDKRGADWGYYYVQADECFYHTVKDFNALTAEEWRTDKECENYLTAKNNYENIEKPASGKIPVAFDDIVSINYFGEALRGYYHASGKNVLDAIRESTANYERVCKICDEEEARMLQDGAAFGEEYLHILKASYRQAIAAHKLVKDGKGRVLFLSKECGSGGCVATVDVTYPSMPLFLAYRPELVKASMEPVFEFARMDVWDYEFAPHDVGMYPFCNGQYYGVKNKEEGKYGRDIGFRDWVSDVLPSYYLYPAGSDIYDFDRQMPVEECADMLLIGAMYLRRSGDKEFIRANFDLLQKWCNYLINDGLIPQNQLCTDDFLSHIDKNVNLSIKSVVSLGAFAQMCEVLGASGEAVRRIAEKRAREIMAMFRGRPSPLSFDDGADSFSMKYNLLCDKLLKLRLFSDEFIEREVDTMLAHACEFGCPLDYRSETTKTDWMLWMAALTEDKEKIRTIVGFIYDFLTRSEDRRAFPDWYDCKTGAAKEFVNRTVQSSTFVLSLRRLMLGK